MVQAQGPLPLPPQEDFCRGTHVFRSTGPSQLPGGGGLALHAAESGGWQGRFLAVSVMHLRQVEVRATLCHSHLSHIQVGRLLCPLLGCPHHFGHLSVMLGSLSVQVTSRAGAPSPF